MSLRNFLNALVLAAAMPAAALAQEATPGERNIEARETPWQVSCVPAGDTGALTCSMVKSLVMGENNRVLAQAAVISGETLNMRIMAPHGLSVPEGLTVSVDGREIAKAPFTTSLPAGIVALLVLTPEIEGALRFGNAMEVTGTQNSGTAFNFQMRLVGFSASVEKVR